MTVRANEDGTGRAAPRKRLRMSVRTRVAYALLFAALTTNGWLVLAGLAVLAAGSRTNGF